MSAHQPLHATRAWLNSERGDLQNRSPRSQADGHRLIVEPSFRPCVIAALLPCPNRIGRLLVLRGRVFLQLLEHDLNRLLQLRVAAGDDLGR